MKPNPIDVWLTTVAYSHSSSRNTRYSYKKSMQDYCMFSETTPEEILAEYETTDERAFKRKHANLILQWITKMYNESLATTTIRSKVGAIKSFYKYSSLPLGFIPQAKERILYHNRDIDANEIAQIIQLSKIREKAIYAVMAQSGLRPCVIQKLRTSMIENLDNEQESYLIQVPEEIEKGKFGSHPTFIGKEARKYLKMYLNTRTDELTPNSLLFVTHKKPETEINTKNLSRAFQYTARKLKKTGHMEYKIRGKGKPSEIRLYTLRKFFRKYANQMGFEHVNYLMGHITKGSDKNYTPKDYEFYRELYEEKALPYLKLEEAKPTDIFQLEQKNKELKNTINEITKRLEELESSLSKKEKPLPELTPEEWKIIEKMIERKSSEYKKARKEHPEEAMKEDEQLRENKKWLEEHPEFWEEIDEKVKQYNQEIREDEIRLEEQRKMLNIFQNIIKKTRK